MDLRFERPPVPHDLHMVGDSSHCALLLLRVQVGDDLHEDSMGRNEMSMAFGVLVARQENESVRVVD